MLSDQRPEFCVPSHMVPSPLSMMEYIFLSPSVGALVGTTSVKMVLLVIESVNHSPSPSVANQ